MSLVYFPFFNAIKLSTPTYFGINEQRTFSLKEGQTGNPDDLLGKSLKVMIMVVSWEQWI